MSTRKLKELMRDLEKNVFAPRRKRTHTARFETLDGLITKYSNNEGDRAFVRSQIEYFHNTYGLPYGDNRLEVLLYNSINNSLLHR